MPETRRAYLAWMLVCVVWGTTYLGIRIALEGIPPFLMAACRWIVAGSLLIGALKLGGERLPPARSWGSLALLGFLLLAVGNGGVVWAEQTVPSGVTAVLVAMAPLWMVGIEAFMPDGQPPTARCLAGLVVGLAGIALLMWPEIRVDAANVGSLGGLIASQIACFGWGLGSTYARRHGRETNVLASAAFQMLFGGLILLAAGLANGEWTAFTLNGRTTAALVYLTVVGSVGGFSAYAYALKHLPVSTVSLYAYVNPVIAVALGTLVFREPFGVHMVLGTGVVLLGMALVRAAP